MSLSLSTDFFKIIFWGFINIKSFSLLASLWAWNTYTKMAFSIEISNLRISSSIAKVQHIQKNKMDGVKEDFVKVCVWFYLSSPLLVKSMLLIKNVVNYVAKLNLIAVVYCFPGYLRITDLGIARIWKPENSSDTSGTPGYMGN